MPDFEPSWANVEQPPDDQSERICFYASKYRILQQGLELILKRIEALNKRAMELGIQEAPYQEDAWYIKTMAEWGEAYLAKNPGLVQESSTIRSLRYLKAGLLLLISAEESKNAEDLPTRIASALEENIAKLRTLSEEKQLKELRPAEVYFELTATERGERDETGQKYHKRVISMTSASPITSPPPSPISIFYCYSHKDLKLREQLETHLSALRRQNLTVEWHDRKIEAGREWETEIDTNLNGAHIVLLLVSAAFIHSDYCYGIEMKRALERHAAGDCRVIPIILSDCDWQKTPLAKLEVLPSKGKPVTGGWRTKDQAFTDVVKGIRKVVEHLSLAS